MSFRIQNHTCIGIRVLFIVGAMILCYLSTSNVYHAFMIGLFAASTPLLTKFSFKIAFRRLMMPFLFVSIAALTVALELSFNTAGSPFIKVVFSKESFAFAIQLFLKSMSVISVVSLGIAMISISEMTAFLRFFRVPELLIELLVMVHHSIQIIGHKTTKLYTAQKSRMAYNGQFKNGLTCFSLLVTSIFSSSLNQIQQQAIALDARCYNNKLVWVLPRKNIKSIQLVWLTIGLSIITIPVFFI